ncbi:MAG: OB-fold nucleic acid binding domain-containing protein [Candidatus Hodarchaeales archaeon]
MSNLEDLIQKVIQETNLSRAEIKKLIDEKKQELLFVNDVAAIHIIAKDLNVTLKKPDLKKKSTITIKQLKEMEEGLSGVSISGVVIRVYNPIEFKSEKGKGVLAPILLHDGSDSIRVILWGEKARYISDKLVERGTIIKIRQGYTKKGRTGNLELHLGDRGILEVDTDTDSDKYPNPEDEIIEIDSIDEEMQEIDTVGTVFKIGQRSVFNRSDGSEGSVGNMLLKGNKNLIRIVFWDKRSETPFDFTRGDVVLIEGVNVKINRDGKPELHCTRTTNITKKGHKNLPSIEDRDNIYSVDKDTPVESKKISNLKIDDNLLAITARVGSVGKEINFNKSDGSQGRLKRALIYDDTGVVTLVLWGDSIDLFDDVGKEVFEAKPLRVNYSKYQTLELHSINETTFSVIENSDILDEPPLFDIKEIKSQKGLVSVHGIITEFSEVREFNRSDGTTGKVTSIKIQDSTGQLRVVAWDKNTEKFEKMKEKNLKYVKIFFGRVRVQNEEPEIHLISQSLIRPSSRIPSALRNIEISTVEETREGKDSKKSQPDFNYKKNELVELDETSDGVLIEVVGKLVKLFQNAPYYWSCSECKKKVTEESGNWVCVQHGKVEPQIRMRLAGIFDDGTSTIRTVFFGTSAEILSGISSKGLRAMIDKGLSDDQILETIQREAEGRTVLIQGRVQVRTQEIQGESILQQELFVNRIYKPEPLKLVDELLSEVQEV